MIPSRVVFFKLSDKQLILKANGRISLFEPFEVIKQRFDDKGRAIQPCLPQSLLVTGVAKNVVKILSPLNSSINITTDHMNIPSIVSEFAEKFDLDNLPRMDVRNCFAMPKFLLWAVSLHLTEFRNTLYLVQNCLTLRVP